MDLQQVLDGETYQGVLQALAGYGIRMAPQRADTRPVRCNLLRQSLLNRHIVLEGAQSKPPTEEELARWLQAQLQNGPALVAFFLAADRAFADAPEEEEFPAGEEPSPEDRPQTIHKQGYAHTSIASRAIDLDLARNHPQKLAAYYKRMRIPGAAAHAAQVQKLYNSLR